MVLRGFVPTSEETLQTLAALRLQSLNSDFSTHAPFPRLEELFPPCVLHARLPPPRHRPPPKCRGARLRAGLLAGGLWGQALAKQRAERDQRLRGRLREEGASTMAAILEKWKLLQGMGRPEAMAAYVALVREWPGFGSTLFDVNLRVVRPRWDGDGDRGQLWQGVALTPRCPPTERAERRAAAAVVGHWRQGRLALQAGGARALGQLLLRPHLLLRRLRQQHFPSLRGGPGPALRDLPGTGSRPSVPLSPPGLSVPRG